MSKQSFIEYVDQVFQEYDVPNDVMEYFETLKSNVSFSMTDNGKKIIKWMQENKQEALSKDIGAGLGVSSRVVAGALRKLVEDGYVSKSNSSPIMYSLTDHGKNYCID